MADIAFPEAPAYSLYMAKEQTPAGSEHVGIEELRRKVNDMIAKLNTEGYKVSLSEDEEYFILKFPDGKELKELYTHKWEKIPVEPETKGGPMIHVPIEDVLRAQIMYPNEDLRTALKHKK